MRTSSVKCRESLSARQPKSIGNKEHYLSSLERAKYYLRDTYAKEIDAKIASGFYERVEYSEWASTTHVVIKSNGKLRITGNYKPTLNPHMIVDEHPIPRADHLFHRMRGATLFCLRYYRCIYALTCRQ